MKRNYTSLISKNYAKALMDISRQDGSFSTVKTELLSVLDILNSSHDLNLVMNNSSVSVSKKTEILKEIFNDKISPKILNLLKIITEKGRFNEFENIVAAYNEMFDNLEKRKNVEIISSFDLDADVKEKILKKLEEKLNSDIIPYWTTDENIIAGLVFKFDNSVIDTSIKSKLKNLSKYMLR